jgi:hypothetical protein
MESDSRRDLERSLARFDAKVREVLASLGALDRKVERTAEETRGRFRRLGHSLTRLDARLGNASRRRRPDA